MTTPATTLPAAPPLPPPEQIHHLAGQVLGRSYYDLDTPATQSFETAEKVLRALKRFFRPIAEALDGLYAFSVPLYYCVLFLLVCVAVALLVHIVATVMAAVRGRHVYPELEGKPTPATAQDWERRASECAQRGDTLGAIRALLCSGLLLLEPALKRPLRRGATNREWLGRFRGAPAHAPLALLVQTVEDRWYGNHPCLPEDYERCTQAHYQLRNVTQGQPTTHAH